MASYGILSCITLTTKKVEYLFYVHKPFEYLLFEDLFKHFANFSFSYYCVVFIYLDIGPLIGYTYCKYVLHTTPSLFIHQMTSFEKQN